MATPNVHSFNFLALVCLSEALPGYVHKHIRCDLPTPMPFPQSHCEHRWYINDGAPPQPMTHHKRAGEIAWQSPSTKPSPLEGGLRGGAPFSTLNNFTAYKAPIPRVKKPPHQITTPQATARFPAAARKNGENTTPHLPTSGHPRRHCEALPSPAPCKSRGNPRQQRRILCSNASFSQHLLLRHHSCYF